MISGFTKDWLATRREELNGRFRLAARRHASLDAEAALELAAELLPPLAGQGEDGANELLSGVYDLILLHCGRGTIAPRGGGTLPGIAVLLRETFPSLRTLLLARPRLVGALSNAVERLGPRGELFARRMMEVGAHVKAGELEPAGAVVAWRLGEARLRAEALRLMRVLPARASLVALGLPDWPDEGASLAAAALAADAWRRPEERVGPDTLKSLPGGRRARLDELAAALREPAPASIASWSPVGTIGDFSGFDGSFEEPPLLVEAPGEESRHVVFAISGDSAWRLDADVYGWTCRPDPAAFQGKVREPQARGKLRSLLLGADDDTPRLAPDGTLAFRGGTASLPAAAGATSFASTPTSLAWTTADSHRIRVATPRPVPL